MDNMKNEDRIRLEESFKAKVKAFVAAAGELTEAWEHLPTDSPLIDGANDVYPFNKSFDELYHDMIEWEFKVQEVQVQK